MNVFEIIGGVILLAISLLLVIVIILQEAHTSNGMNALSGMSEDSYYGKNSKSRTQQGILARWTKISAVAFFVLTIVVSLLAVLMK